eukprot:COSAG02_NODE_183_length_30560_cov_8.912695_28_plen_205_part_00
MPSSPSRHVHREPRKPATHGAASTVKGRENAEQRGPRTAPKGTKLPPSSNPAAACRPARPPRAPRMRAAPPQLHRRRRMAAARPAGAAQERWWAPDATLRRQLSHEPYRSAPPPLRLRVVRSARTAVRRAGGRVAASAPAPSNAGRRSHHPVFQSLETGETGLKKSSNWTVFVRSETGLFFVWAQPDWRLAYTDGPSRSKPETS